MRDVLVIMAKYPEVGRVKTRLAEAVGAASACSLYRAFLSDLDAEFQGAPYEVVWAVSPPGCGLDGVVAGPVGRTIDQRGAGLGERMYNCFEDLFGGGSERVVMMGADIPHLGKKVVGSVFDALEHADVVLVPSRDGGYCLVATRALQDLFTAIQMSTSLVFEQTRNLCVERGLSLHSLEESFDIDELDDVRRLATILDVSGRLPATRAEIAVWRERGLL